MNNKRKKFGMQIPFNIDDIKSELYQIEILINFYVWKFAPYLATRPVKRNNLSASMKSKFKIKEE